MAAETLIRTEFEGIVIEGTMCCGGTPYADTFYITVPLLPGGTATVTHEMTANAFRQFVKIVAATDINAIHRPK
jgi:ABC-type sugar transport system permease subunit